MLAATILPPILEQLSQCYPRLDFHITQLLSPTFEFPELHHRTIDLMLALIPGPLAATKLGDDVSVEIVFEDRLFVVGGMQSRWAQRRKIDLAELAGEPWALPPPGSWTVSLLAEAFGAKGLEMPKIKVATYAIPLLRSLCTTGKYISVFGGLTLLDGKRLGLKVLPVDLPVWPWPVAIVMLKNRTVSPAVERFIEGVRTFTASLSARRR